MLTPVDDDVLCRSTDLSDTVTTTFFSFGESSPPVEDVVCDIEADQLIQILMGLTHGSKLKLHVAIRIKYIVWLTAEKY